MTEVLFMLFVILAFWLPGRCVLSMLHLARRSSEPFALATLVGLLLFTFLTYIFSWMKIPTLILPVLFVADLFALRQRLWKISLQKEHAVALLLVMVASLFFSLPMTAIGISADRMSYHTDDIIHLGYINELTHHFPPDNPGMAGVPLRGYHFFSDFLIAMIHRTTGISETFLYFQGMPILTALLWGLGTYSLLFTWRKRIDASLWGVFLVLFGGSFGWWLSLNGHPEASLRSVFGIDQPASALLNPPYALSVAIVIGALSMAFEYFKTQKIGWLILFGLATGLTPMFKVYAGILLVVAFGFIALTDVLKRKFDVVWVGLMTLAIIGITYGVFAGKGGYLLWAPLWAPHKVLTDSMPWYGYDEKLYTFGKFGMWWRIAGVELYGLWLFVAGNLGTRAIGIALLVLIAIRRQKLPSRFAFMVILMMGTAILIPLLFLQSIKVFEIIQMGWYYPLFGALLGSAGIAWLIRISPTIMGKLLVGLAILAMTVPSSYEDFLSNVFPAPHRIRTSYTRDPYLATLRTLSSDTDYNATVLELPILETPSRHLDILSWYRVTLPYPAALGNKRSFFHSQNIDFPNAPLEARTATIGNVLALERMTGQEATFASTLRSVQENLSDYAIRYVITQFPLKNLAPTKRLSSSPPYYLYSYNQTY